MNKIFRFILLSYVLLALLGAVILSFDVMRLKPIPFIDLLFNTSSAISVTGLTTANLATDFTRYGQLVILALIQIGGFGFMSIVSLILVFIGRKVNFSERRILQESIDLPNMSGIIKFIKKILVFIVIIELIGSIILSINFMRYQPVGDAIYNGVFHAISAFNNAGFSTFRNSLVDFRGDFVVNITISLLVVLGGLGFLVMSEFYEYKRKKIVQLSPHTKIVLVSSIFFILFPMFMLLLFEWDNPKSFGDLSLYEQILSAFFTSINFRTSGFNSIDMSSLHDQSIFFSSIFMVIGAAPGGTAGGLKITTVVVLLVYAYSALQNKDCVLYKRTISDETIKKAFLIFVISIFYITVSILILSAVEDVENMNFLPILFEISSAFGTVGLSLGDGGDLAFSATFDTFGKIYMITLMILGKVGVVIFSFALFKDKNSSAVKYPKEDIVL